MTETKDERAKRQRSDRNHRYYVARGRFIRKTQYGTHIWSGGKVPSEKVQKMFPVRRNGQQVKKSKTVT